MAGKPVLDGSSKVYDSSDVGLVSVKLVCLRPGARSPQGGLLLNMQWAVSIRPAGGLD